uniref:protein-histidine N-methyltransferase n=1 Tax=Schizophyllum commune (strain H4-8 / FGSC 9210) TaxID=578458 RepID=D8QB31_SCHCM
MFKFNFDIEEADTEALNNLSLDEKPNADQKDQPAPPEQAALAAYRSHTVARLLDKLPEVISYTPTDIPLASGRRLTLARRDLFDARYQLIAEADVALPNEVPTGEDSAASGTPSDPTRTPAFLDAPSDLVPGLYEGGLKTWECSLDLVDYLDGLQAGEGTSSDATAISAWAGKRVLEIGCGTAIPSLYLLHEIFQDERRPSEAPHTKITLQDYNASVLELITLPNLLIAWCKFIVSLTVFIELPVSPPPADASIATKPDPTIPGDIHITPTLKAAFLSALSERNIEIELVSGSWENILRERFQDSTLDSTYDMVLTSETIYRTESLDALIGIMRAACPAGAQATSAGSQSAEAGSSEAAAGSSSGPARDISQGCKPLCLVAAKVLYFGVGGGVPDFVRAVEDGGLGRVETVLERTKGVGRKVLRVDWK